MPAAVSGRSLFGGAADDSRESNPNDTTVRAAARTNIKSRALRRDNRSAAREAETVRRTSSILFKEEPVFLQGDAVIGSDVQRMVAVEVKTVARVRKGERRQELPLRVQNEDRAAGGFG